jgi:colanic acid biosynthesis glycosyl transferase WcaI
LGLKSSDVVALYSGAMSNKQGLELVIEAASNTRARNPSVQYVLCGNGPAKPKLTQMAAGAENIRFIDLQPAERLSELLSTADIHLLPQKAEVSDLVLPSKLAGMLASGRPIIAMADPETRLAQETESAGILVRPGDAVALADAIVTLADDETSRIRFGTAARQLAKQRWERNAVICSIELEFLSLIPREPTPAASYIRSPHARSLNGQSLASPIFSRINWRWAQQHSVTEIAPKQPVGEL